ncbi:hypothetical protein Hypma_013366 [Hypsizygus marmoreus]|uniref:Uncharacterized protein n=1 Tax=Hypsizygus marmoreus TaxID=39966 RepID=A0A369JCC6_HYPMA|nr:hypothetical protein Hypma_013366 [Hypsizygus marmoreus]
MWRLVYTGEQGEKEEIIIALQGLIMQKDLPPLKKKLWDAAIDEIIPFREQVDLRHILQSMAREDYVHMKNNQVLYFKRCIDTTKKIKPQLFCIGDIVEIQVSFIIVLLKGNQFKLMTVLHLVSSIKAKATDLVPVILKCKVRYNESGETDDVRLNKKGMDINQVD